MEVLEMLKEQGDKLTNEELKFLIDELNTGSYSADYKEECFGIIDQIKKNRKHDKKEKGKNTIHTVIMTPEEIKDRLDKNALNVEDRFFRDLEIARMTNSGDQIIEKYINDKLLDGDFFLKNLKKFKEPEVRKILELIELSEKQIKELFGLVPQGAIELTQKITEDFFIKHFDELDIKSLKKNKVTDWIINPSLRSKKIVIFLKMKGVKLWLTLTKQKD